MKKQSYEELNRKYGDTNVQELDNDELDRQLIEIGSNRRYPHAALNEMFQIRAEERWMRRISRMKYMFKFSECREDVPSLREIYVDNIKCVNQLLKETVEKAFKAGLNEARKRKKEHDETGEQYHEIIQSKIYMAEFNHHGNVSSDIVNDNDISLLDVLMSKDMMTEEFFVMEFEIENGQGLRCKKMKEYFSPIDDIDAIDHIMLQLSSPLIPFAALCYPLRRLMINHNLTFEDIACISRFNYTIEHIKLGIRK